MARAVRKRLDIRAVMHDAIYKPILNVMVLHLFLLLDVPEKVCIRARKTKMVYVCTTYM